jgi:hypothetical protein
MKYHQLNLYLQSNLPQDWLQKSEDLSLVAFRQQCRVAARRLEQLVMEDLQTPERAATSVDPSALLAEARRRDLGPT